MRPPICAVCDEEFESDGGALVTFRRSAEDEAWYERFDEEELVGHPPNVDWFCHAHANDARRLSDLTLSEAMERIRG